MIRQSGAHKDIVQDGKKGFNINDRNYLFQLTTAQQANFLDGRTHTKIPNGCKSHTDICIKRSSIRRAPTNPNL